MLNLLITLLKKTKYYRHLNVRYRLEDRLYASNLKKGLRELIPEFNAERYANIYLNIVCHDQFNTYREHTGKYNVAHGLTVVLMCLCNPTPPTKKHLYGSSFTMNLYTYLGDYKKSQREVDLLKNMLFLALSRINRNDKLDLRSKLSRSVYHEHGEAWLANFIDKLYNHVVNNKDGYEVIYVNEAFNVFSHVEPRERFIYTRHKASYIAAVTPTLIHVLKSLIEECDDRRVESIREKVLLAI